jgi:hypothetical protein
MVMVEEAQAAPERPEEVQHIHTQVAQDQLMIIPQVDKDGPEVTHQEALHMLWAVEVAPAVKDIQDSDTVVEVWVEWELQAP